MLLKKLIPVMVFCFAISMAGHACAFNLPSNLTNLENMHLINQLPEVGSKNVKSKILEQYAYWKGTRYHFGGSSHNGIDCSALMQVIFHGSMKMKLPRTTEEQIHKGHQIAKNKLKPGDLVFFKTSHTTRHVGVYVGNSNFVHASKIKGVTISSLDNNYWLAHYETARRITENT